MLEGGDPGLRFPPTATAVILDQLRRTRSADRWFYLNAANPHLRFSPAERRRVHETVAESIRASYGIPVIGEAFRVQEGSRSFWPAARPRAPRAAALPPKPSARRRGSCAMGRTRERERRRKVTRQFPRTRRSTGDIEVMRLLPFCKTPYRCHTF
jgi:hypothetical protein